MSASVTQTKQAPLFSPLTRRKVSFEIVAQFTQAIAGGTMQPGTQLPPEPELMAMFGVGRGSIREAIKILEFGGLVEIRRGEGTYVQNSCNFNLLTPLYLSLLWESASPETLCDYFSALDYARIVFGPTRPRSAAGDYYAAAEELECLFQAAMNGEPVDYVAVGRATLAEQEQWNAGHGNLPLELVSSLSYYLFRRTLSPLDSAPVTPADWAAMELTHQLRVSAAKDPTPEKLALYTEAREHSFYDRLISNSQGSSRFRQNRKREGSYVIFWKLVEGMVKGSNDPGSKILTEMEASEKYEVSRSVVREAMKGAEALGLVEIRPGGTFIARENEGLPPIFDPKAYGNIIETQSAEMFLTFKAAIRCALLWLANRNATKEERETYQDLANAFARSMTSIPQDAQRAYQALVKANRYLDEICHNEVLQRVSRITTLVSSGSRTAFVENALALGRQREVVQAYQADAGILTGEVKADIPAVSRAKLALWKSVEGVEDSGEDAPLRTTQNV